MCGRFSERFTWQELVELYRLTFGFQPEDWQPKFNIAPTTLIPVIRFMGEVRVMHLMRWGLVPSWAKEIGKFATFNARADSCESKPTYRGAWKAGRRCIVPASSFFEWRKSDKQPFAIGMANRGPMAFAGLWEDVTSRAGQSVPSCTIITTGGNSLMAPIHDRMPAVLGEEDWAAWLGEAPATEEQLRAMLRPFPAERMAAWPVSKDVGNVRNQGNSIIEERLLGGEATSVG